VTVCRVGCGIIVVMKRAIFICQEVVGSSLLVFSLHSSIVYTSFFFFLTRLEWFFLTFLLYLWHVIWCGCVSVGNGIIPLWSRWYSFVSRLSDHPSLTGVVCASFLFDNTWVVSFLAYLLYLCLLMWQFIVSAIRVVFVLFSQLTATAASFPW